MFAPKATVIRNWQRSANFVRIDICGLLSVLPRIRVPPTSRGALSSKLETSPTAGLGGAETVYAGFADFEARAGKPAPAYAGPV